MDGKPELITTEADALMKLLKDVKEISLADAAKQIGVAPEVVEAWANFLEEEGLLSVKYNFTTPFLVYASPQSHEGNSHIKLTEESENRKSALNELAKLLGLLNNTDQELDKNLAREIHQRIVEFVDKARLARELSEEKTEVVGTLLGAASAMVTRDRIEDAIRLYNRTVVEMKNLPENSTIVQSSQSVPIRAESNLDVRALLNEAYKALSEDRIEDAKRAYNQLKDLYYDLPKDYQQRKANIERDLVKFNNELSGRITVKSSREMESSASKLRSLLGEGSGLIKRGDIEGAVEVYAQMRQIFEKLPDDFPVEKQQLQAGIVDYYNLMSESKRKKLAGDFAAKAVQIDQLLIQVKAEMSAKNVAKAAELYNSIKQVFQQLPKGFVSETIQLQNKLLPVYETIAVAYSEQTSADVAVKSRQIRELISKMNSLVAQKDFKKAEDVYQSVKDIYGRLPEGFLSENTDLQLKILNAYESMVARAEEVYLGEFTAKVADLTVMIEEAEDFIRKKDYELASELYGGIAQGYNSLPPGFLHEKAMVHKNIIRLYSEIMLNIDSAVLSSAAQTTQRKYREILKLLIRVRNHVDKNEFGLLEAAYKEARALFDELPVGFVHQKTKLRDELLEIGLELHLYHKALELRAQLESQDHEGLKELALELRIEGQKLEQSVPEDRQLFAYIAGVCNACLGTVPIPSPPAQQTALPQEDFTARISELKRRANPTVRLLHK